MSLPNYKNAYDFKEKSIGTIYLTGAGFVNEPFKGSSPTSLYGWQELIWKKTPPRNSILVFNTMDDIDVGLVARCEISYEYMNYEQFIKLRKIVNRERHFMATFFDVDEKKWTTRDMYCTESSKNQLHTLGQKLIGMRGVTLKLVGTNLDISDFVETDNGISVILQKYNITYNGCEAYGVAPTNIVASYSEQVRLSDNSWVTTVPEGKYIDGWVAKRNGNIIGYYGFNQSITVWNDLELYPNVKDTQ